MDAVPLMVAVDRPAQRIRVKLKLVKFAAERTTPTGDGNLDEGDEVLK